VDILGRKDNSLRFLVTELLRYLPSKSFVLVDHWDHDPFAMGLAKPSNHDRFVFITSDRDVHGLYFMSCKLPSDNDLHGYHNVEADPFNNVEALAKAIEAHLGAA
jgi:hypothetical protein